MVFVAFILHRPRAFSYIMSFILTGASILSDFISFISSKILSLGISLSVLTLTRGRSPFKTLTDVQIVLTGWKTSFFTKPSPFGQRPCSIIYRNVYGIYSGNYNYDSRFTSRCNGNRNESNTFFNL